MPNAITRKFHRTFAALAAAARAAGAVEAHRAPKGRDLEILGIDPAAFKRIDL